MTPVEYTLQREVDRLKDENLQLRSVFEVAEEINSWMLGWDDDSSCEDLIWELNAMCMKLCEAVRRLEIE